SAKNKLINSLHLAMEFHSLLPKFLDPAITEGYEGFNHLTDIKGLVEESHVKYIIRNHDSELFKKQQEDFLKVESYLNSKYQYEAVKVNIKTQYLNMYEIIKKHPHIIEYAVEATKNNGLEPKFEAIRGGTDGARLTWGGLPCPNLGTGGYHFHGRLEFASINQMEKAVLIYLDIVRLIATKK